MGSRSPFADSPRVCCHLASVARLGPLFVSETGLLSLPPPLLLLVVVPLPLLPPPPLLPLLLLLLLGNVFLRATTEETTPTRDAGGAGFGHVQ